MDENLFFVALIIVSLVFIIQRNPIMIFTILIILISYAFYKRYFANPKEFINYSKNKIQEFFDPNLCAFNDEKCGGGYTRSDTNFLTDAVRNRFLTEGRLPNDMQALKLDKRTIINDESKTIQDLMNEVPPLTDMMIYYEKLIKFTLSIDTHDRIQNEFIAKKLKNKMTRIFYSAYNTMTDKLYPINNYNELLVIEKEFNDVLNTFIFLGMNYHDEVQLNKLQEEFIDLSRQLNSHVVEYVNTTMKNDFDITVNLLPPVDDPTPANLYD